MAKESIYQDTLEINISIDTLGSTLVELQEKYPIENGWEIGNPENFIVDGNNIGFHIDVYQYDLDSFIEENTIKSTEFLVYKTDKDSVEEAVERVKKCYENNDCTFSLPRIVFTHPDGEVTFVLSVSRYVSKEEIISKSRII